MGKRFILIRHAKTEEGLGKTDKERNLIEKGIWKMNMYADIAKNKMENLDIIFSSNANRTMQTAKIIQKKCPHVSILTQEELYVFDSSYLSFIQNVDIKFDYVAIVGHNYSLEYTLNLLLQTPREKPVHAKTSCMACFYSPSDQWALITPKNVQLEWILNG
jgi:phosphohistidine phosphatase SixA